MFRSVFGAFRTEERGQDLAEYCLLTALVALVAVAIFVHFSGGIQAVWGSANTMLAAGDSATTSGPSSAASSSQR
ncbi:MAG TPA: hypothetical protein VMH28_06090 [Candidatus Acidoferrales bacterium]|nr:hypothetical protein [Candidatus Acidoferrales bacterium]